MFRGVPLRGPGVVSGVVRQGGSVFPRSSRSISSFNNSQLFKSSARLEKQHGLLAGRPSFKSSPSVRAWSAARFNSTSAATTTTTVASVAENGSESTVEKAADVLSEVDLTAIPERIGYLKEIGLDYGWGPSSIVQYIIEHIHIYSDLPWWASIIGCGVLFRLAMVKPTFIAADNGAKLSNLKPIMEPIRAKMFHEMRSKNQQVAMKLKAELAQITEQNGIKNYRSFLPMIQIPFSIGCYRVVYGMTSLPVPGLAMESLGWLKDLTVADPYFLLPVMTTLFMYLTIRKGGESGMSNMKDTSFGKFFMYGLPTLSFAFMANFPAALQLYFLAMGTTALIQSYLLANDSFRKFANITIPQRFPSATTTESPAIESANNSIRLLADRIEAEKAKLAKASPPGKPDPTISLIDRAVNSSKGFVSELKRETTEKMQEFSGKGPQTNADGTPAAPPRLNEKDMKLASDYERRRREEEEWKREERNHARREAHMKALQMEREKAAQSWKAAAAKSKNKQR
ncbi:hypothetical protein ASPZODRAFT_14629 [Penicilliopsis zonata CBS 506.65]|uniref:Membrane insertase YidC/Oxa/ALB C-terminal domain-containing protein n=1 Tax=Penicilliopsis zonata CBS 506.65 TaxID=1073090 RepID=A0A1L9SN66_9EURO|nr:hypothetical protein ASPZODRAFT_14629 [Penicilliopsis zonata CBS 506.65]OJJ48494.1 hypothetical protein ASPZODRAFT_14629 [Penicilliopsis zonata CBS 506.65]